MVHRITLLIPGRANSRIIKISGEPGYFHSLFVEPGYRRQGYGLELMKFAIQHLQEFLQMDILRRSKSCQRNAARLGYRNTGNVSERYQGCELWEHCSFPEQLPVSRLRLLRTVHYDRKDSNTDVLYLSRQFQKLNKTSISTTLWASRTWTPANERLPIEKGSLVAL